MNRIKIICILIIIISIISIHSFSLCDGDFDVDDYYSTSHNCMNIDKIESVDNYGDWAELYLLFTTKHYDYVKVHFLEKDSNGNYIISDEQIELDKKLVGAYADKFIELKPGKTNSSFKEIRDELDIITKQRRNGVEEDGGMTPAEISDLVSSLQAEAPSPTVDNLASKSDEEISKLRQGVDKLKKQEENHPGTVSNDQMTYVDQLDRALNADERDREERAKETPIYTAPNITDKDRTVAGSIDGIINDGDEFLNKDNELAKGLTPQTGDLQEFSSIMYNILFVIGVVVAVIMGAVLGIKFMMASVEGKAQIKEWLVKYAVGCAIVFGAFGAWKIVITILEQIA